MNRRTPKGEVPSRASKAERERRTRRGKTEAWVLLPVLLLVWGALVLPSSRRSDTREDARIQRPQTNEPPPAPPTPPRSSLARSTSLGTSRPPSTAPLPEAGRATDDEVPSDRNPGTATVVITIRDAGTGRVLPGARVELGHTLTGAAAESIRVFSADESGKVRASFAPGDLRAVAWHERLSGGPTYLELHARSHTESELALELAHEVTGRVVDSASGAPVDGARVTFWTFCERDVVRTSLDGSFRHERFPSSASAEQIRVEAPGYGATIRYLRIDADGSWEAPAAVETETTYAGTGVPWIEIALVRELRVVGTVTDSEGRPISADVSAEGFFHVLPSVASRDDATVAATADGEFELSGLRSDIGHTLLIEAPGFARETVELEAGVSGTVPVGVVVLRRESLLAGVVIDPDGHPVEDIEITLVPTASDATRRGPTSVGDSHPGPVMDVAVRVESIEDIGRTTPDGTFLFDRLRERAYTLTVSRELDALVTIEIEPRVGGGFDALELRLPSETFTMLGRIDGLRELEDVTIELERFGAVGRVTSDAEGRFRVAGLDSESPYLVTVHGVQRASGIAMRAEIEAFAYDEPIIALEPYAASRIVRVAQRMSE